MKNSLIKKNYKIKIILLEVVYNIILLEVVYNIILLFKKFHL
jgi:hypothetical protein